MTTITLPDDGVHATVAPWPGPDDGDAGRLLRGLAIAATTPYLKVPGGWLTPSQADPNVTYRLARDEDGTYCSCPDHAQTARACKHLYGLEYRLRREQTAKVLRDGLEERQQGAISGHAATNGHAQATVPDKPAPALNEPEPERLVIRCMPETNPAPPPATAPHSTLYNQAQENESKHFIRLLWDLVNTVPEPPHGRGRTPAELRKSLYGLIHRVYTTKSGRRSYSDLYVAAGIMGIGELPSRPTLTRYMQDEALTPILTDLVEVSAVPLSPLETRFAADSTGFGTTIRDEMWADAKWGDKESRKAFTGTTWTKSHFLTGVRTNIITAAYVTHSLAKSGDAPQLPKLLYATNRHFDIEQVYADKAYLSGKNLRAIIDLGANAYIPFRSNSVYHSPRTKAGRLWNRLLTDFREHEEEFYAQYHKRSNVESTNSALKRLFGHLTRSKHPVARVNEVLARAVAYNVTRVIHAMYGSGIVPFFGSE